MFLSFTFVYLVMVTILQHSKIIFVIHKILWFTSMAYYENPIFNLKYLS